MLEVFFFFLCIIHLNYNTVNKLNVFRLKFPLILQLSDTVTVLRNIDTHTHTYFCFVWGLFRSTVSGGVSDSCNSVTEMNKAPVWTGEWRKQKSASGIYQNLQREEEQPVSLYGVIPFNFKYNIHHFLWFSFLPTKWTIAENLTVPLNIPLFILLTRANSNYLLTHCNGFWNFSQALQAVYCYC